MAKKPKIDKQKYEVKDSNTKYALGGLLLAIPIAVAIFFSGGQDSNSNALAGPAPSGSNCPENVAYIQTGVNIYQQKVGQFPTDVNQLLETVNGQGPFVETVPPCPSGNIYVIDNGVVKEAAPQK